MAQPVSPPAFVRERGAIMVESLRKAPAHLWIVGALSLLWNGYGAFTYFMTKTRNQAYLAQFTAEQRAYFDSYPLIPSIGWGLGVWGALAGSLLLLARSRFAAHAFGVSLLGMAISFGYQFTASDIPADMIEGPMVLMTAGIVAIGIGLLAYAHRVRQAGVLR